MKKLKTQLTDTDAKSARLIALRARVQFPDIKITDTYWDIIITHLNGNPLKLEDLYLSDDLNFSHDVLGIREYLNRETGSLEHCFIPRLSAS